MRKARMNQPEIERQAQYVFLNCYFPPIDVENGKFLYILLDNNNNRRSEVPVRLLLFD